MSFWCKHCGSRNHLAFDCSKKHLTYQPTAEEAGELKAKEPKPEPPKPSEPEPMFEAKPRFKGCPPICTFANLPSFETEVKAIKWASQFEGHSVKKKGEYPLATRNKMW